MLLKFSVLVLWILLAWESTQQLEQSPRFLSIQEGENFIAYCNSTSTFSSLQWYRQKPGEGPVHLTTLSKGGEMKKHKSLTARFGEARKDSYLLIIAAQPGDASMYLCAANSGNSPPVFGKGTRLSVIPNVKEPDPAVYQLGGSKSNQISVCLFTDFDSETNVQEPQGPAVISLNSTVLDMKVMNSKSNAALAWGNSTDFKCNGTFNEKFFSSSDFSCDATLIAKNFETDMNLNFHNLIVIGLRILLLKVAGFNLFMTLRLWSR